MAWVESHQTLANHPKTRRLCRALGISRVQAIGHLHMLWWWALDYAPDGDLTGFPAQDVADGCEWEGDPHALASALESSGFMDEDNRLHDWEQYGGKFIKRREQARERQQRYRDQRGRYSPSSNAEVTRDKRVSNTSTGEDKTREERRGEDKATDGAVAPVAKGKPRKRIPDSWAMTDELRRYAVEHGIPAGRVEEFADEFKRYWKSDGGVKADWDLTFMNRARDQAWRYQARSAGANGGERRASPAGFARIAQEGLP